MGGDARRPPRQSSGRDSAEGNTRGLSGGVLREPGRPPVLQAKSDICKGAPRGGSGVPEAGGDGRQDHRGRQPQASTSFDSPFGVIPKKGRAGRWRLIADLSSPDGHSVNDGISRELSSLSYMSVDDVMAEVVRRGKGTLMEKMDIKQAYRNIPMHPVDRVLLGMHWQGRVFVDGCLPFGLRSAPLLFTAVGDLLQWVMERRGVSWLGHYIDDFVTLGDSGAVDCRDHLQVMKAVCEGTGMPTENHCAELLRNGAGL